METTDRSLMTALWTPGWYELDQSLAVGDTGQFWFFQNPPQDLPGIERVDFVFFNQLSSAANCQVRTARILSMDHNALGKVNRVDTGGLDYIFTLDQGEEIVVNAEEDPGAVYNRDERVDDWSLRVQLVDVSEPLAGDQIQ